MPIPDFDPLAVHTSDDCKRVLADLVAAKHAAERDGALSDLAAVEQSIERALRRLSWLLSIERTGRPAYPA